MASLSNSKGVPIWQFPKFPTSTSPLPDTIYSFEWNNSPRPCVWSRNKCAWCRSYLDNVVFGRLTVSIAFGRAKNKSAKNLFTALLKNLRPDTVPVIEHRHAAVLMMWGTGYLREESAFLSSVLVPRSAAMHLRSRECQEGGTAMASTSKKRKTGWSSETSSVSFPRKDIWRNNFCPAAFRGCRLVLWGVRVLHSTPPPCTWNLDTNIDSNVTLNRS